MRRDLDLRRPISRRVVLERLAVVSFAVSPLAGLVTACGRGGNGEGPDGGMPDWMMDDGMGRQMMSDMRVIRDLLRGHGEIQREVEDIDAGIRARTVSDDPDLAEQIRTHVWRMNSRVEENQPIRVMDPVFREIFEHHDAIAMEIVDLPDGVEVTETSPDPQVQLLIRQHAHRAVSEFVASGMSRAREPTPLPDGYRE